MHQAPSCVHRLIDRSLDLGVAQSPCSTGGLGYRGRFFVLVYGMGVLSIEPSGRMYRALVGAMALPPVVLLSVPLRPRHA
jgi:hypothetical protein